MKSMKRVCAWCKRDLGSNENYEVEGDITHGMCSLCAIRLTTGEARSLKQILNCVEEPVFVLDHDRFVKAANDRALEMLGKDDAHIENQLGGDVFECSYASLEGGCGNTIHCKTCAIRNIITETLATGSGYKHVPAYQNISTADGEKILKFLISTEKVGERILLRIDDVGWGDSA